MTDLERTVHRVTIGALDGSMGCDRGRKLVTSLTPGDLIQIRPQGTRRPVSVSLFDVYRFALRCAVGRFDRRVRELRRSGMKTAQARRVARKESAL